MRAWLAIALVLTALAGAGAGGLADGERRPAAPRPLLPDLVQKAPYDLRIVTRGDRFLLAFASATENVGAGPLVIEGRRPGARRVMAARQVIRRSGGASVERRLGRLLVYHSATTHEHWHLLRFARYVLRREGSSRVVRVRKAGFCLGDRYRSARVASAPRRWTHQCGRDRPGLARIREGISVGWGDDYVAGVHGQWVDVTSLRAGRYVLVHRANPRRFLRERAYGNNASSVLVELLRPAGERPRVRVLARCPGAATCSDQPSRSPTRAAAPSSESRIARMGWASPTKIGVSRSV